MGGVRKLAELYIKVIKIKYERKRNVSECLYYCVYQLKHMNWFDH